MKRREIACHGVKRQAGREQNSQNQHFFHRG